jgi:hypothetical protein
MPCQRVNGSRKTVVATTNCSVGFTYCRIPTVESRTRRVP